QARSDSPARIDRQPQAWSGRSTDRSDTPSARIPDRYSDHSSAADAAMRARRTLDMPSYDRNRGSSQADSRPVERHPSTSYDRQSADRQSTADAAVRARRTLDAPAYDRNRTEPPADSRPIDRRPATSYDR